VTGRGTIVVGVGMLVAWPLSLSPQHMTVPKGGAGVTAQVCKAPARDLDGAGRQRHRGGRGDEIRCGTRLSEMIVAAAEDAD
jgi:hypothetical protein